MLYISKGMVLDQPKEQILEVSHCGVKHMLTGIGAQLWLDGRFGIEETNDERKIRHLCELQRLGLVETSEEVGSLAMYRLLTRCIICPAKSKTIRSLLSPMEKRMWKWISKAGLRLTIGELVKLVTDGVMPSPNLLGKDQAQDLTLRIYAGDLTFETTPDLQMETSPKRDAVASAVLGLLRKRRLIMI